MGRCPDCGGEGRIFGTYGHEHSSMECETCAPQVPLEPFTEEELSDWERSLEEKYRGPREA